MKRSLPVVSIFLLAGCATFAPPPTVFRAIVAPADVEAATRELEPGSGTIKGSALIRQRGGGIVTCAGTDVYLFPATESTSREMLRIFQSEKGYVPQSDGGMGATFVRPPDPNRQGLCNAQGFFTFDKVRPGKWYVMTQVTWTAGYSTEGGTLLAPANVPDGGEIEVVLTYQ